MARRLFLLLAACCLGVGAEPLFGLGSHDSYGDGVGDGDGQVLPVAAVQVEEASSGCRTVYDDVWEEKCQTVYDEVCGPEVRQVCRPASQKVCQIQEDKKCTFVMKDKCASVPVPKCDVEVIKSCAVETSCKTVDVHECLPSNKRVCNTFRKQQCDNVTDNVCTTDHQQVCDVVQERQCSLVAVPLAPTLPLASSQASSTAGHGSVHDQGHFGQVGVTSVGRELEVLQGKFQDKINAKLALKGAKLEGLVAKKLAKLDKKPKGGDGGKHKRSLGFLQEKLGKKFGQKFGHDDHESGLGGHVQRVERCESVPKEVCRQVPVNVCRDVAREVCREMPVEECHNESAELCRDVPREQCSDHEVCRDHPKKICYVENQEKCVKLPSQECELVPREVCSTRPQEVCKDVEQSVCRSVPQRKCEKITVSRPRQVCDQPVRVVGGDTW